MLHRVPNLGGSCGHSNDFSSSVIKGGEFVDKLSHC